MDNFLQSFKKQRALFNLLRSICATMAACGSDTRNFLKRVAACCVEMAGNLNQKVDAKVALSTTGSNHCWLQETFKTLIGYWLTQ